MLSLPSCLRVYLAAHPVDMRKSFLGLQLLTRDLLRQDPLSGHLFAFCNRRRNLLKLLFWDGSGYWIFAKRLERGTFAWPSLDSADPCLTLSAEDLSFILGGLDLAQLVRRKWWRRAPSAWASDAHHLGTQPQIRM